MKPDYPTEPHPTPRTVSSPNHHHHHTISEAEPNAGGGTKHLTVEFLGELVHLAPSDRLSFGRAADLIIDSNPEMHRVVGEFHFFEGGWWVTNLGRSVVLELTDRDSVSSMRVAPGATARVGFASATLGFSTGSAAYALGVSAPSAPLGDPSPTTVPVDAEATRRADALPLTPEQRVLVAALAEPWLRTGAPASVPTNRHIANALGWPLTKFNRKLDAICKKLTDGGVGGLVGSVDQLARDRRQTLVEHAVYSGLISVDDLDILEAARTAAATRAPSSSPTPLDPTAP